MSTQRLSDPNSRRDKLRAAALVLAMCLVVPVLAQSRLESSPAQTVVVTLMLLACAVYVIRRDFWWVADEVWDVGDGLRVRCNGHEAAVPFSAVEKVTLLPRHSRFVIAVDFTREIPSIGDGAVFYPARADLSDSAAVEALVQSLRERATGRGAA